MCNSDVSSDMFHSYDGFGPREAFGQRRHEIATVRLPGNPNLSVAAERPPVLSQQRACKTIAGCLDSETREAGVLGRRMHHSVTSGAAVVPISGESWPAEYKPCHHVCRGRETRRTAKRRLRPEPMAVKRQRGEGRFLVPEQDPPCDTDTGGTQVGTCLPSQARYSHLITDTPSDLERGCAATPSSGEQRSSSTPGTSDFSSGSQEERLKEAMSPHDCRDSALAVDLLDAAAITNLSAANRLFNRLQSSPGGFNMMVPVEANSTFCCIGHILNATAFTVVVASSFLQRLLVSTTEIRSALQHVPRHLFPEAHALLDQLIVAGRAPALPVHEARSSHAVCKELLQVGLACTIIAQKYLEGASDPRRMRVVLDRIRGDGCRSIMPLEMKVLEHLNWKLNPVP